jgi:hypothetical protein
MRILGFLVLMIVPGTVLAAGFEGWQGMRVIQLAGQPDRIYAADLGGDGRDELILINARQARLDIYRWLPPAERTTDDKPDPDRPNELPLAPDWSRGEISIDEMPLDVVAHDVNSDGRPELLVLTSPSNRVSIYSQTKAGPADEKGVWKKTGHWNMLAGSPTGRGGYLIIRDLPQKKHELLVSYEQGIQQLLLEPLARPNWLSPRENRGRIDWRLTDFDGDGDDDLIEWSQMARQTIRWYESGTDGKLLPAQGLHEHAIDEFDILRRSKQASELLLLGGNTDGLLRRYQLARGEANDLGRQDSLPLAGGGKTGWCGIQLDKQAAIVAVDTAQPRLRVHPLGTNGWLAEQTYPTIGGVRALAAPAAKPGLLLVWTKDASDLHRSRWEHGRLTYPELWKLDEAAGERKILALDTIGDTTWWAQKVGSDLDLYIWPAGRAEPDKRRFTGVAAKAEKLVWLGHDRILLQDAYSTSAKLVSIQDGKTISTTLPQLAKVELGEYQLFSVDGKLRSGRITDGVLQWLGDDLQPVDQIMLSEGQKLSSYLPIAKGEAWALEAGGVFMHRLKADDSGVMRTIATIKPPQGSALRGDAVLGVMLLDQERVVRLSRGQPWELKLIDSIDSRVGRRSGVSESTIHRIFTTDLTGDGVDEVVLTDDRRHQLTALVREKDSLKSNMTWQVFEDQKYPYGDGGERGLVPEPRRLVGLNADGDEVRDLALISQDRLILYIGKDKP